MNTITEMTRDDMRAILKSSAVSQAKVARALGVSQRMISGWLNGSITSRPLEQSMPIYVRGIQAAREAT